MSAQSRAKRATGLGIAIVTRREELGFRRKDLAEMAQLSYPYLSEIENGTKNPSGEAFDAIAAALDLAPQELRDLEKYHEVGGLEERAEPVDRGMPPAQIHHSLSASATTQRVESSLVESLTAEVMRQIEPIVKAAVSRALKGQA